MFDETGIKIVPLGVKRTPAPKQWWSVGFSERTNWKPVSIRDRVRLAAFSDCKQSCFSQCKTFLPNHTLAVLKNNRKWVWVFFFFVKKVPPPTLSHTLTSSSATTQKQTHNLVDQWTWRPRLILLGSACFCPNAFVLSSQASADGTRTRQELFSQQEAGSLFGPTLCRM